MSKLLGTMEFAGKFGFRHFEAREVLREMERQDPEGEKLARADALFRAALFGLPQDFEEVASGVGPNTVSLQWYDFVFDTMLKGDSYTANVRMGLFGNDVSPSASLTNSNFRATLGEATDFTVDSGNSTNRSTTTFAASSSQTSTNAASPSRFTFTGSDTIYGAFLTHGATLKDGTQDGSAIYIAGAKFSASQPVSSSSIIDVVYAQSKAS